MFIIYIVLTSAMNALIMLTWTLGGRIFFANLHYYWTYFEFICLCHCFLIIRLHSSSLNLIYFFFFFWTPLTIIYFCQLMGNATVLNIHLTGYLMFTPEKDQYRSPVVQTSFFKRNWLRFLLRAALAVNQTNPWCGSVSLWMENGVS